MNAVVCVPVCPLYTEPNCDSPQADDAMCGWSLEVLEEPCPGWFRVRTQYRYEGFAPCRLLVTGAGCVRRWEERKKLIVLQAAADVLNRPDIQGRCLITLTRGALAAPVGKPEGDGWQKITLPDGQEGYIRSSYLGTYYQEPASQDPEVLRQRVVDTALSYLGTQYRWGGKSAQGLDCSGLVFMSYFLNGIQPYRDAEIVSGFPVQEITQGAMAPGDLLFFPGHVALYLGDGRYIHSTAKEGSAGVVINSLDPEAENYRADLAESLTAVGSVFPPESP